MKQAAKAAFFIQSRRAGRKAAVGASLYRTVIKEGKKMAGIYTRSEVDKIIRNGELTDEQKTEQLFALYNRALDDGFVSKRAAEEAKNQAVEAAKAGFKVPEPIDPKTTPEYMEVAQERDMLRAIGGDDFSKVKPKFRETVFGMLDRGEKAAAVSDQLSGIREKYEEYFLQEEQKADSPKPQNLPQYSQNPGRPGTNPDSDEDKLYKQLSAQW